MEEELNENDLEERLYAMIHHVDGTQADENTEPSQDVIPHVEAPRSTVKRYWRTSHNSSYQKINTPKDAPASKTTLGNVNKNPPAIVNKTPAPVYSSHTAATNTIDPKPKEEKNDAPDSLPPALAILQNTAPQNFEKTIEILEIDDPHKIFQLDSSDEDEVIEVALPPKPTITIESSDEDELIVLQNNKTKHNAKENGSKKNKSPNKSNRDVSASPVASVVSSMSDDFIRGDCIALNISAAQPDSQTFDFSLHGSDLLVDGTPSKKRKKKKSKDCTTSTPIATEPTHDPQNIDNVFATPKSKAKNKKSKTKSYAVSEKIIPNADVYDSDSNQSVIDVPKNHEAYIVTEKSFPSADVYESDSVLEVESIRNTGKQPAKRNTNDNDSSDSNTSSQLSVNTTRNITDKTLVVDLTNDFTMLDNTGIHIEENIVIGNISGYSDVHESGDDGFINITTTPKEVGRFCSTKVPQILYEDLDFDNLKGKDKVCKRRRYSLTTLRAEMEKFYNESWGGENFNHQEIQKNMSRDKSLWVIDPKDRMPNPPKRRVTCNYCNKVGHRDDTCRLKPPVCYMCGHAGHYEPRCPRKICVNCGSPNFMYSTMCRNCAPWRHVACSECGRLGHPSYHCPDTWRRYHNTIDENMPLESCPEKPQYQLQCSGCARRGHLAHSCRTFLPLCALPVPDARVLRYRRLHPPTDTPHTPEGRNKRVSKSPVNHETHVPKRRTASEADPDRTPKQTKNLRNEPVEKATPEKTPEVAPIGSSNRDGNGRMIQDNEVSDTSEVRTSARIYMSDELAARLRTPEGRRWMAGTAKTLDVDVDVDDSGSFLTVVGTVGDQEAFQAELRAWRAGLASGDRNTVSAPTSGTPTTEGHTDRPVCTLPRNKNDMLRTLKQAFDSLEADIGDPDVIYKELTYLQNNHEKIKKQKVVNPQQLSNNRKGINKMLKKLNMVLLGQAGLAGGAECLSALHGLHEKVTNTRNKKLPLPLRSEIGQHYDMIFTALPRDDYKDLVQKFYSGSPAAFKKKENSLVGPKPKKNKKKLRSTLPNFIGINPCAVRPERPTIEGSTAVGKPFKVNKLMKRLSVAHSLLLKGRLAGEFNSKRCVIASNIETILRRLHESEGQTKKLQMEVKEALRIESRAKIFLRGSERKERDSHEKKKQKKMLS